MTKPSKNEIEMLELVNKIQAQLIALDMKVDTLIGRSFAEPKPAPRPPVNNSRPIIKTNDHANERTMHTAICADCKKECKIPFKPSGDRPVYCQDCFSKRKMVSMSRIGMDDKPKAAPVVQPVTETIIDVQRIQARRKKAPDAAKKPVAKKKPTVKKK